MSFLNICEEYKDTDVKEFFRDISAEDVKKTLRSERLNGRDFLSLLSSRAEGYLEDMAQKANKITLRNFGKTIPLYTPIYLSNYCDNECVYCGFNPRVNSGFKKLSLDEVEKEAEFIEKTGLEHVLVLTGGSRSGSPLSYIKDCVKVLKRHFSSVSAEIYALTEEEYGELIDSGVDGLTIYQEVYDRYVYDKVHVSGPKKDYLFRLDAPERAAKKGMRTVNIGVLLGLNVWQKEIFMTALHAKYLFDKYPATEVSVSVPRIRPNTGNYIPGYAVTDKNIAQIILALRIFLPRVGITLSTRESSEFRDNLIPLGVTRMSAGSTTAVGGHTAGHNERKGADQFSIADTRDVDDVRKSLLEKGYQPVSKDWMNI